MISHAIHHNAIPRLVLFCVIAFLCIISAQSPPAHSLPRMAMTAGAPCATCHVDPQGGGMRTEIGWGVSSMTGAWQYDDIGMDFMTEPLSNEIIEGLLSIGFDSRLQVAKMGRPQVVLNGADQPRAQAPNRRIFPMQLQGYVGVRPFDSLTIYGTYAASRGGCDTPFAGQSCYMAQAIYRPSPKLPAIRTGMIQPSIGIRHDDHTMLMRHDAANPRGTLIPPNYAELGAEITYQPVYWMHAEAGAFRSGHLAQAIANPAVVTDSDVAYLARIGWMPRIDINATTTVVGWLGISTYGSGNFRIDNLFLGAGMLDRLSIFLEAARLEYGPDVERNGRNLSAMISLQSYEWLIFEGRVEEARTYLNNDLYRTRAAVFGIQFFPLPYIEVRPEYRYTTIQEYAMGQYALQLHLYY